MGLRRAAVAAAAAACALAGCADEDSKPAPREVAGPAQRAAEVVERLDRAVRARDFATVCDDLLTPAARRRAGAERCVATMREAARGVEDPRVRVISIQLTGRRAEARVRSRADGQVPVEETLRLERSGSGYRIAALGR